MKRPISAYRTLWSRAVVAAVAGFALGAAGCATDRDPSTLYAPEDVGTLVVDGLLVVNRSLPPIWLSRAGAPDADYDAAAAAERAAGVRVVRVSAGDTLPYLESATPGEYHALVNHTVRPQETYALEVRTALGEVVRAVTTTPPALQIADWVLLTDDGAAVQRRLRTFADLGDSVYYAPENQLIYARGLLEGRFTRPEVPGFQVGLSSIDLDSGFIIDPDFFEEDDFADLDREGTSPALEAPEGQIRLPWLAVAFGGRHIFRVLALDRNAFDLVRSTPPADGSGFAFGGNLGDNFDRPIFHVDGGIGLFGSATSDSIGFFALPAP